MTGTFCIFTLLNITNETVIACIIWQGVTIVSKQGKNTLAMISNICMQIYNNLRTKT